MRIEEHNKFVDMSQLEGGLAILATELHDAYLTEQPPENAAF